MSIVRVEVDAVVERPVEQVFARATDLAGFAGWMPRNGVFRKTDQISAGPVGTGTTYLDKGTMGTFHGEVVEFRPPTSVIYEEKLRWLGLRVVDARLRYSFRPVARGTAVHHVAESELHGVFRIMRPLVARIGPGERNRTVDAIKRSLESEPPEAAPATRRAA